MWRILRIVTVVGLVVVSQISVRNVVAQSPSAPGLPWMDPSLSAEQRADLLVAQMTLEQKVQQISNDVRPAQDPANRPKGCGFAGSGRHIQGIAALGIPTVRMTNGSTGIIGGDCTNPVGTGVPSTSAVAATFNPAMGWQLGDILGDEARRHGHQVLLGPTVNPVRHPYGGRNYQLYSEDPYLSGLMGSETIKGIQAHGIHAVPKHYAGNEQETSRRFGESVIPPRALHEIYLLPFEMAVRDTQPASIMCAYNRLNGVSACSSAELLDGTLRDRWGFGGYVMTDRSALHDVAPSIKAGVDWELAHRTPVHYALEPQPDRPDNKASEGIRPALEAGSITVGDIDQMLRRRYVQMFKAGHFETDFDVLFAATPDFFSHGLMVREIAEQAIVLLKNENNILPLSTANLQSVALIGAPWFAGVAKLPVRGGDDNTPFNEPGNPPYSVTPQEGLENVLRMLGSPATVTYESGGGTGTRADIDKAVALAKKSEVVIVMVGDDPSEGCDLQSLRLPIVPPADMDFCAWEELTPGEYTLTSPKRGKGTDQEALMQALTADAVVAQKMVVVLKTQGMVVMPWLDKVPALLEAWYPGQEDGTVVANVLFGLRNPSGKLPVTFGTSEREAAYATPEQFPGVWGPAPFWADDEALSPQYSEGMQVGYRWYEATGVAPLFPFGFGLSYTTFAYGGLSVSPVVDPSGTRAVLNVTYTITNTGSRQGAEASQVYLRLPAEAGQPSKRLVGFQKVDLGPGESRQVTVTVDSAASNHPFSYWVPLRDASEPGWSLGNWRSAPGDYTVLVGTSSADTPLQAAVTIPFVNPPVLTLPPDFAPTTASDIVVWRPEFGTWFIRSAATLYTESSSIGWGAGSLGDRPVAADYDGDTEVDLAVWRESDGTWYVTTSSTSFNQSFTVQWGAPGDRPVPGDYDGDGKADPAVWRPSTGEWYVVSSRNQYQSLVTVQWGSAALHDMPVAADFDGDDRTDIAVWRPESGTWFVLTSESGFARHFEVQWGAGALGDVPVIGDFDGDDRAEIAVWRPGDGTWHVTTSSTNYQGSFVVQWGAGSLGDVPVASDFDGDGRSDIAVWRPGDGTWYVTPSSTEYSSSFTVQWGSGALQDQPVVAAPVFNTPFLPAPSLIADPAHVARVRESLRLGEPQFQDALVALEATADRALNLMPVSVMDKPVTPPSGDKHDYMSQAPYWWPDPSEPDGRPYIRRDGRRNPEIDRISDHENLDRVIAAVATLGLSFFLTGREQYAQHASTLLGVWFLNPATRMNPHLRFAQGIPGIAEGRSAGIIETGALPNLLSGVVALQGSAAWTISDDDALKAWSSAYVQWLLDSPFGREQTRRGNNQETWYRVQVVALALYTGQNAIARQTLEESRDSIRRQFEPDGRQPRELERTRAWDYSVFNLTAFLQLASLGDRVGVDLWNYATTDGRSLRKGIEFLLPFATYEETFPYEQISRFRPASLHPILRRAAVSWNDPRYAEIAQRIGGGTRQMALTLP
jgi:beta-glucosidase